MFSGNFMCFFSCSINCKGISIINMDCFNIIIDIMRSNIIFFKLFISRGWNCIVIIMSKKDNWCFVNSSYI